MFTGDGSRFPVGSSDGASQVKGLEDDDLLTTEPDPSMLRDFPTRREQVINTLGTFFQGLAVVMILIGVACVAELFRRGKDSLVTVQLEEWMHAVLPGQGDNQGWGLVFLVGVPVVLAVASAWFFFRLGRSLQRHSPLARWLAVFVLAVACVPP